MGKVLVSALVAGFAFSLIGFAVGVIVRGIADAF